MVGPCGTWCCAKISSNRHRRLESAGPSRDHVQTRIEKSPESPEAVARMQHIPLFRPQAEIDECRAGVEGAIWRVIASGTYVNGPECQHFEDAVAQWCGVPFAVAVSSGTMALELLLKADGVGPGCRVVLTAHTFVAVLEAILAVGAEPTFVDINPETWQMPTGNWPGSTVIVSHLYGSASAATGSTCQQLYEDASQSFGGLLNGARLGTLSRAAAVSLYPTKNLSAVGDAGVILTSDGDLALRLRALRNHGQTAPQVHEYVGTTGRIDELQAAILCEKLQMLDKFVEQRQRAARFYTDELSSLPIRLPTEVPGSVPVPNLFVLRTDDRERLRSTLQAKGIGTGIHYPTPLHKMSAYRNKQWAAVSLPETEALCRETLTLPLWAGISAEEQARVVQAVRVHF